MWGQFEQHKESIKAYFKQPPYRAESGQSRDELSAACVEIAAGNEPKAVRHAKMMAYVLDHTRLAVNRDDWFADGFEGGYIVSKQRDAWKNEAYAPMRAACSEAEKRGEACRAFSSWDDFGHTAPYWERLLLLGLPGVLQDIRTHRVAGIGAAQRAFYDSCEIAYEAVMRFMLRLADEAERAGGEQLQTAAENLRNLTRRAPQTMHEAMQLLFVYYFTELRVEGTTVRSIGMLDRLLLPFYRADLQSGAYTAAQLRELLQYFLYRFFAANIGSNLPFSLCGTDADGNDLTNELSYLILEVYGELNVPSPKLHLLCSNGTPESVKELAMRLIQAGSNSIVFANSEVFAQALRNIGVEEADARRFVLVGCYEPSVIGKEIPCTCNGRISLPKAVEYALTNGVDLLTGEQVGPQTGNAASFADFDAFYNAVTAQTRYFTDTVIHRVSSMEEQYPEVHHAPLISANYEEALTRGVDVYSGGAKYNNSSINMLGLATAADALYVIKQLVYEEKRLTLPQLCEILRQNWAGQELLRLHCKNDYAKYGNNHAEVDALAVRLANDAAVMINNRSNGRGGRFRAGFFSIDWRMEFGQYTGASADGRKAGEPLSKNIGATAGADVQGATAHILSATKIDYTKIPNGTALDLVFHSSAASGEAGLHALMAMLNVFLARGGVAFQCNIFDPSVLRAAQKEPEKYATLQVRLCGWNVYFTDLGKTEQEEFIRQAENAG